MLSCQGHRGVTRDFPHTPGIDAAGVVVVSDSDNWKPGDNVIMTGFLFGMSHWGGWSEFACVPDNWLVKLPKGLSFKESMMFGTAGLTAAMCVNKLIHGG